MNRAPRDDGLDAIEGSIDALLRAPLTISGFPSIRPAQCRDITTALSRHLDRARVPGGSDAPFESERFFALVERFRQSRVRDYPNEVLHLDMVHAEALLLTGRGEEALAMTQAWAERPQLIEGDRSSLIRAFELDGLVRHRIGRTAGLRGTMLARLLLLLRLRPIAARALFRRFTPLLAADASATSAPLPFESLVAAAARTAQWLRVRMRGRFVLEAAKWIIDSCMGGFLVALARIGVHGAVQATQPPPRANPFPDDLLVSRAMGGLGDILMMTPGLRALARMRGSPVRFATRTQFFPVLEHNPDLRLIDIDEVLDIGAYRRWFNLSFCPAARYESRAAPRIARGRVELFAAAMGVGPGALARYGAQPVCILSEEQQRQRGAFRSSWSPAALPIIGIQPFSRELYRSFDRILEVAHRVADRARVVCFHSSALDVPPHPNLTLVTGQPLRETLPLVAACDYFVCVDSAFLHLAGAFDIPTLAIFGPTDARIRTGHHPRCRTIEAASSFPCAPCWRNEDTPCSVTGGNVSACLAAIRVEDVIDALSRLMAEFGPAGSAPDEMG